MDVEKSPVDNVESNSRNSSSGVENNAITEKSERVEQVEQVEQGKHDVVQPTALPNEAGDDDIVTLKTWIVVVILSCSYGLSFWVVPALSSVQTQIATELGNTGNSAWWTTVYTMSNAIAFMLFGGNSDLFGRRWFIISGNVAVFVGLIVIGAAKSTDAIIAANCVIGLGAGLCQLAAFALPELLPNRIRHIGILIADASTWVAVLFGPIVSRFAIRQGESWRWLFYGPAIATGVSFSLLVWLYHPPKHPRGVPWHQAVRQLDYVGAFLFTVGAVLVFTGVIYTTIVPSSDPRVLGPLVAGFVVVAIFALHERYVPLQQPMTPPKIFAKDKGREFTFPFIAGTIVNMFFYSVNIAYPTMINVLWTDADTPLSYSLEITLPQNLGLIFGSMMLWFFGIKIGHWKWQFIISFSVMTIFGALLALAKRDNMPMIMVFCFICEAAYGWSQTLSITWIQFGVPQTELGISGALAGVARWTGGALSSSIYLAILSSVQQSNAARGIPAAAIAAGADSSTANALVSAIPLGAEAIEKIPGVTTAIIQAASAAFVDSYIVGLRTICLVSIAFGVVGIICCCLSNDIGPKMTPKIEVFLENDIQKNKNKYH